MTEECEHKGTSVAWMENGKLYDACSQCGDLTPHEIQDGPLIKPYGPFSEEKQDCEHSWDGAPSGNKCIYCGVNYPSEHASSHPAWKADPVSHAVSECRHVWITSLIHGFVCAVCDTPVSINNLWPVVVKGGTREDLKKMVRVLTDEIISRGADKERDTKEGEP